MKKTIHFQKYRFLAFGFSLALGVIFAVGTIANNGFNMGIDFMGGNKVIAKFTEKVEEHTIRNSLKSFSPSVQRYGQAESNEFIIATKLMDSVEQKDQAENPVVQTLQRDFSGVQILSIENVGPAIGDYLRYSALKLIMISVVLMTVYLAFRFEFKYSVGAMIALVHDMTLSFLLCGFLGIEVSIPIIAALLTIFGYSVNDTIVIFDRIREHLREKTHTSIIDLIDISITQTITRTLLTSLLTLFAVLSVYMLGSESLNDFATVLFFGIVIGTYSSIYIASPVVIYWEKLFPKK